VIVSCRPTCSVSHELTLFDRIHLSCSRIATRYGRYHYAVEGRLTDVRQLIKFIKEKTSLPLGAAVSPCHFGVETSS
jgi:hypothetical protein